MWALGWGKVVVFYRKQADIWGLAFDMDIQTFLAWPVDMLASHHPLYCGTKVNISLAWSKHILWPMGSIALCILPPIYASLLFFFLDMVLLVYLFPVFWGRPGGRVWPCPCDASDTGLLQHAHCGTLHCTPPPLPISQPTSSSSSSSSMFLDTLHHPLAPPQHLCLVSTTDSMKELERTHELKPKPGKKNQKNKTKSASKKSHFAASLCRSLGSIETFCPQSSCLTWTLKMPEVFVFLIMIFLFYFFIF